jgi:hypothetical protein
LVLLVILAAFRRGGAAILDHLMYFLLTDHQLRGVSSGQRDVSLIVEEGLGLQRHRDEFLAILLKLNRHLSNLKYILTHFNRAHSQQMDWNAYKEYTPEKVMEIFKSVFIG